VSVQLVLILVLLLVFLIATVLPVHMGALALVAAFIAAYFIYGLDEELPYDDAVFSFFPGDLFVVLVGVTYLFAIAKNNGTVDWLVHAAVKASGGRLAAIPWAMFAVTGALTAIGGVVPAVVAIIAPVGMSFARRYGINPVLMGLFIINGATAGGFSPLSVFGVITNTVVRQNDLAGSPLFLWGASIVINILLSILVFFLFGGRKLLGGGRVDTATPATTTSSRPPSPATRRRTPARTSRAAGPATAVGSTSTGGAAVSGGRVTDARARPARAPPQQGRGPGGRQGAADHRDRRGAARHAGDHAGPRPLPDPRRAAAAGRRRPRLRPRHRPAGRHRRRDPLAGRPARREGRRRQIAWPTVLLICGIVTYVGLMQDQDVPGWLGENVAQLGLPLLAALLICYIGGVVSAFASTTGILGALIPLAVPFLQGPEAVGAIGLITALALSSSIVDSSPFSTSGRWSWPTPPRPSGTGPSGTSSSGASRWSQRSPGHWLALVVPGWL
jgi:Na+/H+ antiporter NhaD/arsenite permease-like protein